MNKSCCSLRGQSKAFLADRFNFKVFSKLKSLILCAAALGSFLLLLPAAARAGWLMELPPDLVSAKSDRRNNIFYVGDAVKFTLNRAAARYEVRDYYGEVVAQGAGTAANGMITINVAQPGWYKLYLFKEQAVEPWGNVVGGTMFVILRPNSNFPALPPPSTPGGSYPAADAVVRGVGGVGPERLFAADAADPAAAIAKLETDILLEQQYYMPFDPVRGRVLMIAFPNGTAGKEAGVRQIVEHFKDRVQYWEPRNEPNGGASGTQFVTNELIPFYQTVKSVSANLKVMGPGVVSVSPAGNLLGWIEEFLQAGGANYIDVFSFHCYNNVNGDVWLARKSLDELNKVLARYNAQNIEKWQTEQGYFAAMYGAYEPRHQGRWTMLQMMIYEQYGIPKEHNHLWYVRSHGFWDFPTWYINEDGSPNPAFPLMRVWSEELYGTRFKQAFDFGESGNKLYVGSLFEAPNLGVAGKRTAVFMSAGDTRGKIELKFTGGNLVKTVSPLGVAADLMADSSGRLLLTVGELPSYVELQPGQTVQVVKPEWGPNLALQPGVSIAASGSPAHPLDQTISNSPLKMINGELENWYYTQQRDSRPWMSNTTFPASTPGAPPATVELTLPVAQTIAHVVIHANTPWQNQGTLLDYALQYQTATGEWQTIERVQEPAKTLKIFTPPTRTKVDSFHSKRSILEHHFAAVKTKKLRLLIYAVTFGGGATRDVAEAGGQTGLPQLSLREIEVYGNYAVNSRYKIGGRLTNSAGAAGLSNASVTLESGGRVLATVNTDAGGNYNFPDLPAGAAYAVAARLNNYTFAPSKLTVSELSRNETANFVATKIPDVSGTGLWGEYFAQSEANFNLYPQDRRATRVDANINFSNFNGSTPPPTGVGPTLFAARWSGQIEPRTTGLYTFRAHADDGVRLWINNQQIINNWTFNPPTHDFTGTANLVAGERANIVIEYFNLHGDGYMQLFWSNPSFAQEIVPQNRLYPSVPNQAPSVAANVTRPSGRRFAPTVKLAVDVFDLDGSIGKVEYFVDDRKIGEATAAPYVFSLPVPPFGQRKIYVRVTDNAGATTVSPITAFDWNSR